MYIGNHLSASKGYTAMGEMALELGANTFAYFTRNPRGGRAKALVPSDLENFLQLAKEHGFGKLVAHAPYTLNLCAIKHEVLDFSLEVMAEDLKRLENLPGNYYNFHPGSHVGAGIDVGIERVAEGLNQLLTQDQSTIVLLETMAGKGSEVGSSFEELRAIIDRVKLPEKMGVCFDTCHVWDAGYDIVNKLDGVLDEFDRVIGLDKIYAVHLNDSLNICGSHKDRHTRLGEGRIGAEALRRVVTHPVLRDKPFIIETPNDDEGYKKEIAMVREWAE